MTNAIEARLERGLTRWVAAIERRPGVVLAVSLALTAVVGIYAALRLGVDADPRSLIAEDLPFQVRQRELTQTFHTLADGFLVVIDADSPVAAGRAADALAAELARRQDLFTQVEVPGGGPFYARHALLYLTPDELDDLVTRLSTVQPFLAALERDPSVAGVADLLRDALAARRRGTALGVELDMALERVAAAVLATADHRPAPDPWGTALLGGALPDEARQRVVALRGRLDYGSLLNAQPHIAAVREAARALALTPERGFRVRVTGEPVLNYEELLAIGRQAQVVGVVSFVLFSVAVALAFRSPRLTLALITGLLVGLAWSNAFAAATIGHLNQISACVNVLLIGLGGELQIHACMRYRELIAGGASRSQALRETAASTGPALFSSACTTAIGFFIFLLTDFTGVAQLGLIAGTGMFLSFASAFTVIPAVLAVGAPPLGRPAAAQMAPWMAGLARLPRRWARPIRIATAIVAVASLTLLPRLRFNYNLLDLRDPGTESVETFEDLLSRPGSTPWTIDVIAPSLDAARALVVRLRALDTVGEVRTIDDYIPGDQEEKLQILETAAFLLPERAEPVMHSAEAQRLALERLAEEAARTAAQVQDEALARAARRFGDSLERFLAGLPAERSTTAALAGLQANMVGSLPEQLRDLRALLAPAPITMRELPPELVDDMLAADGRARIEVLAREDLSDSVALERFVDQVRTVAPEATGSAVWQVEWGRTTWRAMVRALSIGLLCMTVFLVVLWRSAWDTLLAFFPLALAMIVTGAILAAFGQPFNFANVIVLPMLVGMGIDNGIHLVHRHRTRPDEIDILASSTARAVFFAALTTILTFGSLGLTSHRGLASFGQLLTLGVLLTLVCYVIVLPAVLEWDDRRK